MKGDGAVPPLEGLNSYSGMNCRGVEGEQDLFDESCNRIDHVIKEGSSGLSCDEILQLFSAVQGLPSQLMDIIRNESDEEKRYAYARFALSQIGFIYTSRKKKSGWYLQNFMIRYHNSLVP